MPFIGLTGNFGHGKTTVLKLFKKSGAHILNADHIVHELLKKPAIIRKLVSIMGEEILFTRLSKRYINKKRMAEVIFNDSKKRRAVEKILHPKVMRRAVNLKKQIQKKNKQAVIIFEVPLLFEAGYGDIFDATIAVCCSRATAIQRMMRAGMSQENIKQRLRAQMPVSKKEAMADYVINNNSGLRDIGLQVKKLHNKLIH
jgi:dephospho-CoA kinase